MSSLPSETPPEWRPEFPPRPRTPRWDVAPLTAALIALSIAATLYIDFGKNLPAMRQLAISEYDGVAYGFFLPEVRQGQIWRLITPIFLHFSTIHLVFNLLWLKDLGSAIERVIGVRTLALLVLVVGFISNLAQYLASGPEFGGMSGVVYGLFGYVWMMAKLAPQSGFLMPQQTIYIMLGWLVVCMTGWVGSVANFAHAVGVACGVVCGYISAKMFPSAQNGESTSN